MKEKHIQILSIVLSIISAIFIVWVYSYEPKNFSEVVTKATVTVGTYQIDKAKFDEGLRLFRAENYSAARELFNQADSEKRDSRTQFYLAYSFYRQGWGRISNNNQLFQQSLDALNRVEPNFRSDDEDLKLKTPAELRNELEEGIKVTADDFNPLKVLRERK